ncbi:unnamed protein product, partial [Ixodes hexagonus]
RVKWPVATTEALIRIWEDNLPLLRSNTRNARLYVLMATELNAGLPHDAEPYSPKQVRQKLENLSKRYRKLRRFGTTTGSKGASWPFYWSLHSFLGSLPINDEYMMEENLEVPVVTEAHEDSEVVASCDQEDAMVHEGGATTRSRSAFEQPDSPSTESYCMTDVAGLSSGSPAETTTGSRGAGSTGDSSGSSQNKSRKRPAGSAMQQLLTIHKEESQRAAKAKKRGYKLRKDLLQLQRESNDMQGSMIRLMEAYFATKANKE